LKQLRKNKYKNKLHYIIIYGYGVSSVFGRPHMCVFMVFMQVTILHEQTPAYVHTVSTMQ